MHPLAQAMQDGERPDIDHIVRAWSGFVPLLAELADTPQDAEWHAEGSVHVHTGMVFEQAAAIVDASAFLQSEAGAADRLTLLLAAVFHDIGKPLTTRTRDIAGRERVISPRHAVRGRSAIALRLPELDLPRPVEAQVLALVGLHHDPRIMVNDAANRKLHNPDAAFKRIASMVRPDLLVLLEQADLKGRIGPGLKTQLEVLDLFRIGCEQAEVWPDEPGSDLNWRDEWAERIAAQFPQLAADRRELLLGRGCRDLWAGRCRSIEEVLARVHRFSTPNTAELILTVGPSGSGKSSWIRREHPEATVISMDEIRLQLTGKRDDQSRNGEVFQQAKAELKQALRPLRLPHPSAKAHTSDSPRTVIWDATSLLRSQRERLVRIGEDYHALVSIAAFRNTVSALRATNKKRCDPILDDALERQFESLEWPFTDEADAVRIIDRRPQM